jgi:16S rRNA (cytosine967-C5)-methyltransferase
VTPGARLQAAIEILDALASGGRPADQALKAWGQAHRFAGSGDRRAIGDRVYGVLREKGRLGGGDGRALVLASLRYLDGMLADEIGKMFDGGRFSPAPLSDAERAALADGADAEALGLPDFLEEELRESFGHDWRAEAEALLRGRAPLDVRINTQKVSVEQARGALPASSSTPWSAVGLRLDGSPDLQSQPQFDAGWFEVQDEGSQLAAFLAAGGAASGLWVDYCAGGGGKTLALSTAQPREERERLVATDVDQRRLDAIRPRLQRAGVAAELRQLGQEGQGVDDLTGQAALVLVDAPCSASGTWRRRPDAAWRLTEAEISRLNALQSAILERAAALVAPGGRLAYVTCSVFDCENGAVVRAFAERRPEFAPVPIIGAATSPFLTGAARQRLAALAGEGHTLQLSPHRTNTDGFFVALFERTP